ncbi:MAG: hypothetical protein E7623_02175 [Ruminococcaceae bacterium]|nr:hypothetical protein [Oscillospiraceae bacterium]
MKTLTRIVVLVFCLLMALSPIVSAAPYATYTYSINSTPMKSPDAYVPYKQYGSLEMGLSSDPLLNPTDLECDDEGNVYIADKENNRIVVLDKYFKFKFQIDAFVNGNGINDALLQPQGVFPGKEYIYVCDTGNARIVVFNKDGSFAKIFNRPESELFEENSVYTPVAVAVDEAGTGSVYVISSSTFQGVIVLNGDTGEFRNFIGAQQVSYNLFDIIWRNFQTAEQKAKNENYVSTEYNNISIDEKGFVYVTSSSGNAANPSKTDKKGTTAPVKKLNARGDDIMDRSGFFAPIGEISTVDDITGSEYTSGASRITDVAIGPNETWSIIDETRGRTFTYDRSGNLLFAFGDLGTQIGALEYIAAITYRGDELLILDKNMSNITVYKRTEYGDLLLSAVGLTNDRDYTGASELWEDVLQRNNNFDLAYVGLGKSYYRVGDWNNAMEMFKAAYDTTNYSSALMMYRKEWISKYAIIIPIVVVVVCILVSKFLGFAGKVNRKVAVSGGKRTFGQELIYGFHLIFHPFDGFWDLKHEKRGSVRAALVYILAVVAAMTYNSIGKGYVFAPMKSYSSIYVTMISVLVPLLLWVVSNWCLTTLFEGEGSMKDIFIATCYSLLPIVLTMVPATLLTNVLTLNEAKIVTLVTSIGAVWAALLIFFGMITTHDYTTFKGIATSLGTIVGMAFIIFIITLFGTLIMKIVTFVMNIITEVSYRL